MMGEYLIIYIVYVRGGAKAKIAKGQTAAAAADRFLSLFLALTAATGEQPKNKEP